MNENSNPDQSLIISYMTLRKAVGFLGIFLPFVLVIGLSYASNCDAVQNSISDYYYSRLGSYFTGTLCAVSLFLFSYNGYDNRDKIASKIAAVFALGVVFFPTAPADQSLCNLYNTYSGHTANIIHFSSATVFFLTLAFFSFFLFTKTSGEVTPEKIIRNRIYRICGVLIVLSILMIFLYVQVPWVTRQLRDYKPIFCLETVALLAFGFSWLIKGEFLLKDK